MGAGGHFVRGRLYVEPLPSRRADRAALNARPAGTGPGSGVLVGGTTVALLRECGIMPVRDRAYPYIPTPA